MKLRQRELVFGSISSPLGTLGELRVVRYGFHCEWHLSHGVGEEDLRDVASVTGRLDGFGQALLEKQRPPTVKAESTLVQSPLLSLLVVIELFFPTK